MSIGTRITVLCTAAVVVSAGALTLRSALSDRAASAPVRVKRAAFPAAATLRADLQSRGFAMIGESEFNSPDGQAWTAAMFHHARAGDMTVITQGNAVHVLRVEADYVPSERGTSVARLLDQWLPGVLDVVDVLQQAPYMGTPISIIGRRRFYMWLTLGPTVAESESRHLRMELRTPTGQETFIHATRAAQTTTRGVINLE